VSRLSILSNMLECDFIGRSVYSSLERSLGCYKSQTLLRPNSLSLRMNFLCKWEVVDHYCEDSRNPHSIQRSVAIDI